MGAIFWIVVVLVTLAGTVEAHERWAAIATDHRDKVVAGQGGTIDAAKQDLLKHCHTHCQLVAFVAIPHEHRH